MPSEHSKSGSSTPVAEQSAVGDRDRSEDLQDDDGHDDGNGSEQPARKRQRVRLSCLECRRRKLSCDRGFPCERCIKSGTPERCTYETRPGLAPPAKNGLSQGALTNFDSRLAAYAAIGDGGMIPPYRRDSHRSAGTPSSSTQHHADVVGGGSDRIRRLELEVAQLRAMLTQSDKDKNEGSKAKTAALSDGSTTVHDDDSPADKGDGNAGQSPPSTFVEHIYGSGGAATTQVGDELRFFRGKEFKTRYFGPHNACMAFSELTGLCPFMKETAEEWLRPLHVHHFKSKDRAKRMHEREDMFARPDAELEALLPSRDETDVLVDIYLNQFEQVHRIMHIPSFRRDYASFWDGQKTRPSAFTALLLSMMAISSCLRGNPTGRFVGLVSQSHYMAEQWIAACEAWSQRQSQKHRKLVHYQVACLVYLAKRVNTVKKKRFWKASGALVQDAVSVGLHRDPSHIHENVSAYNQEMRRRIWSTIQEFDMQASFDHGLPTLLSALRFDVHSPRNLADEDFDEDSTVLPPSRPPDEYTFSSYQHLSRQSLELRLQLSRVLTGPPDDLDYDQVIRYTNDITQEIDALPSWDVRAIAESQAKASPDRDILTAAHLTPLLAYTLLHIQLRQYIIPLHQPYLKLRKTNSKYQYSEIIYYNAARDMVLLHDKLAEQGVRTLNFMREDALTLSINLCSVTMLQPRGSTNMIMVNSQHTMRLLEKCLAMKEDRVLRCGNNEPWGYSIMCAATGLLEAHLGQKTPEAAKASSAERFVNLHCKLLVRQDGPQQQQQDQQDEPERHEQRQAPPLLQPQLPQSLLAPPAKMTMGILGNEVLDRPKPTAPFFSMSQGSSQGGGIGMGPDAIQPTTAWWMANMANMASMANPNADASQIQIPQGLNSEFNVELMGLSLGNLWADYSWEETKEPREGSSLHSRSSATSPAAASPTRAPRLPAPHLLAESSAPILSDFHSCADPRQSRPAYLIPKIPGLEGLVDNDTDSDDGVPHMTSAGTVSTSAGPAISRSACNSIKGSASSPLSLLKTHMEALRHFPSSESTRSRALSVASDEDDFAAMARRAEVRRIAHKMIQEELQKEQHPPPTHSHRRVAMSTIREDPSDVASSYGGPSRNAKNSCNRATQRDGQHVVIENTSFGCSHIQADFLQKADGGTPLFPEETNLPRTFQLKSRSRISLPRGFRIRSRIRGAVGEKRWGKATLVTVRSRQSSEVAALDEETAVSPLQPVDQISESLGVTRKRPSIGCESCFVSLLGGASLDDSRKNTTVSSDQRAIGNANGTFSTVHVENTRTACPEHKPTSRHVSYVSESLGSYDEDGSIHEAHEAHIVAASKPSSPTLCICGSCGKGQQPMLSDGPESRSSCHLCTAASTHIQNGEHRSGPSVASHISTLNLPSPVVELNSIVDGGRSLKSRKDSQSWTTCRDFPPLNVSDDDSKSFSEAISRRRSTGFPFQFRSLSRKWPRQLCYCNTLKLTPNSGLGGSKALKDIELDEDLQPTAPSGHMRSRSVDTRGFPESWWNAVPDMPTEPKHATGANTSSPDGVLEAQPLSVNTLDKADIIVASEKSVNEQGGLMFLSSRVMSASFEKVFKMGLNKIMPRRQSVSVTQTQDDSVPTYSSQKLDAHVPDGVLQPHFNVMDESVDTLPVKLPPPGPETELPRIERRLSEASMSTCPNRSQEDMISDIDSVFGVLISADNSQDKGRQTPVNVNMGVVADKSWPPLTAPSTPVSNAYAEVRAYIITNFSENTAMAATKRIAKSSGGSESCEPDTNQQSGKSSVDTAPVPEPKAIRGDAISIKSDSAHVVKKPGTSLASSKYMTWNCPTRVPQEPMRSTLEFGLELERVLSGEKENMELFAGRAKFPIIKYGQ
ncbi:c6 zinc finger domain containing protein [Grosmannia clavigera kw1407]|uniref:C6 zinc finger domain containing protein n=1 Tax=Grosmannia clavigera (strain kw1407 / UAMH 11150) TaxID=655863 RepID=F0XA77_GROCL|nr:c6 zinc finger domain containing protein [Grosmannia clavigera kw1407]EFX05764.1 c6 zinc finger domain containing protein [Grosmannia clavigera kw1407]